MACERCRKERTLHEAAVWDGCELKTLLLCSDCLERLGDWD